MVGIQTKTEPFDSFWFPSISTCSGTLRNKLGDKGEVIILIGYHYTGGYKLFDASRRRVLISWDLIVDEIKEQQ